MIVQVSGKVVGDLEREKLLGAVDDLWLTSGVYCKEFERKLSNFTGKRHVILCNSGSSANLLALSTLELPPQSQVITTALNFPTTVAPILQVGAVPVFIDVELPSMTVDVSLLEQALTPDTRAVMLAHTLGYPLNVNEIRYFCSKHNLKFISDSCDALGTEGAFEGDLNTLSFYPAHMITTGEGGAVLIDDAKLAKIVESYRDWGRACWCGTGEDNTCGKRFDYELDHKYTYSHIGYNLKMGDFQGALGSAQMDRLPGFIQKRKGNHRYLYEQCMEFRLDKYFILPPNEDHSWFGFTLICKEGIERNKIAKWLDSQGVHNRPVFAGNILKQPGYKKINCGIASGLTNTDIVHYNALWVGCWPGLNKEHLDYTISKLVEYTK
jgi:CDP-6-deoxy-D-xylo-4-hexulose-3-dehydrase